jgi:hypothetical protein
MDQEVAIQAELDRLVAEHDHYEKLLEELLSAPFPTADHQMEELRLKKLKLHTKDMIENLRHGHQPAVA